MIIYHYDPDDFFFLGQENHKEIPDAGLPAHSTNIPPPDYEKGYIPVFNKELSNWSIKEDKFHRIKFKEINYNSGKKNSEYVPLHLSMNNYAIPRYPRIPRIINPNVLTGVIVQKNRLIHKQFEELNDRYRALQKNIKSNPYCMLSMEFGLDAPAPHFEKLYNKPNIFTEYKLLSEQWVYSIRQLLDRLIQITYLMTHIEEFRSEYKIQIDGIGWLDKRNKKKHEKYSEVYKIWHGDEDKYQADNTNFLYIINDLFNSYKHTFAVDDSYNIYGETEMTLISYSCPYNNYKELLNYHNHSMMQIMIGYQNTLLRIFENQKTYINNNAKKPS